MLALIACSNHFICFLPGRKVTETARISASVHPLRLSGTLWCRHAAGGLHAAQLRFWPLHPVPNHISRFCPVPHHRPDVLHFSKRARRRLRSEQTERQASLSTCARRETLLLRTLKKKKKCLLKTFKMNLLSIAHSRMWSEFGRVCGCCTKKLQSFCMPKKVF